MYRVHFVKPNSNVEHIIFVSKNNYKRTLQAMKQNGDVCIQVVAK